MKTTPNSQFTRRQFVSGSLAAAALSSLPSIAGAAETPAASRNASSATPSGRKIKVGVVGNGGRGGWIARLFKEHGGYDMWAVADYFQDVADKCGDEIGVDRSRRFSTLSGYKRLIESGVEAVVLETPPYFMPEQAQAAVEAGLHVYMAKPVAADVPGALKVLAAGTRARRQQRCFLIDYQMPTDPVNIDVVNRIHSGMLGPIAELRSTAISGMLNDPPKTDTLESRLQELIWVSDVAMGCDVLGNFDIHAIDAALWVLRQRPVAAFGLSRISRPDPHGDARDVCSLIYEYADGTVHNHYGLGLKNNAPVELSVDVGGTNATALVNYWGKAYVRGGRGHVTGTVENLYEAGAKRNIARFHREVTENIFTNDTLERSVDGVLTCVLGYEAAARRKRLTMDEVLKENKRLEVDLRGLKA